MMYDENVTAARAWAEDVRPVTRASERDAMLREGQAHVLHLLGIVESGAALEPGDPDCLHTWRLQETGYVRTWHIDRRSSEEIVGVYSGTEDFSDDGDVRLACKSCGAEQAIPADVEVDFL